MYTPLDEADRNSATPLGEGLWKTSIIELDNTREEIIAEVQRAPDRRIDNMITNLYNSARLLGLHVQILEIVRKTFVKERFKVYGGSASTIIAGNGIALSLFLFAPEIWGVCGMLSVSSIAGGGNFIIYIFKKFKKIFY